MGAVMGMASKMPQIIDFLLKAVISMVTEHQAATKTRINKASSANRPGGLTRTVLSEGIIIDQSKGNDNKIRALSTTSPPIIPLRPTKCWLPAGRGRMNAAAGHNKGSNKSNAHQIGFLAILSMRKMFAPGKKASHANLELVLRAIMKSMVAEKKWNRIMAYQRILPN